MPVTSAEVAELKAQLRARPIENADNPFSILRTPAEQLGFLIYQLRSIGADESEVLHDVELAIRVTEQDREGLRECRDTFVKLNYPRDLTKLLTKLSAKAKPRWRWKPRGLIKQTIDL